MLPEFAGTHIHDASVSRSFVSHEDLSSSMCIEESKGVATYACWATIKTIASMTELVICSLLTTYWAGEATIMLAQQVIAHGLNGSESFILLAVATEAQS